MTQTLDAFRNDARSWLADNFPPALKNQAPPGIAGFGAKFTGDWKIWQERLGEKGWSTPTYPSEYGGGGLSPEQTAVLRDEMKAAGAINPIGGFGTMMWGPTLLDYGTDEQKKRYIQPMLDNHWGGTMALTESDAGSNVGVGRTKAIINLIASSSSWRAHTERDLYNRGRERGLVARSYCPNPQTTGTFSRIIGALSGARSKRSNAYS